MTAMIGPSGVGKSHIASALGLHLIEQGIRVKWFPAASLLQLLQQAKRDQACLRPRDRFWDIPVPKIDSAFDNLLVPQPSWSPSTTQQLRKLVAAPYLAPNDWTPRSEAYFVGSSPD
ncbi:ATP-binding protein [Thiolapillus sp.]|uniref:ATP-binding protein n=1 Tax=Thiolapillus sp. TaxID=2017437 RepID=UPI003AF7D146